MNTHRMLQELRRALDGPVDMTRRDEWCERAHYDARRYRGKTVREAVADYCLRATPTFPPGPRATLVSIELAGRRGALANSLEAVADWMDDHEITCWQEILTLPDWLDC